MELDSNNPSAFFRAATMKDKVSRSIPLPSFLADDLRKIRPAEGQRDKQVFFGLFPHYETFRADLKRAGIPHRDSAGHVVHFHSFRKTHATLAARYGIALKATKEVLGHSDPRLTANVYTEMPAESIRAELKKLPKITKDGVEKPASDCAPVSGGRGLLGSDGGTRGSAVGSDDGVAFNLKRRVAAALDTIWQNLEMVDATGLEPVTPCV